ncbi:hypothetical protein D3C86_1854300 [compost metagenome]
MVASRIPAVQAISLGLPKRRSMAYSSITLNSPAKADANRTAQGVPPNARIAPASSHRLRGGFSRKGCPSRRGVTQSLSRCICMAIPATRASVEPCNW